MTTLRYQIASDLERDGMALEGWNHSDELVIEVFYSDITKTFTVNTFNNDLDVDLINQAIVEAKQRLPPA